MGLGMRPRPQLRPSYLQVHPCYLPLSMQRTQRWQQLLLKRAPLHAAVLDAAGAPVDGGAIAGGAP